VVDIRKNCGRTPVLGGFSSLDGHLRGIGEITRTHGPGAQAVEVL
jgi:hypothetical protein